MSRLTLVSAPPGFGKTTLVAQWIAAQGAGWSTAWVSLEPSDNEPATFWAYVVAAVAKAVPGAGSGARGLLEEGQPRADRLVTALVNDLAELEGELVIVLDDVHVIEAREITEGIGFLLDHLPPRVHLVLLTRSDPPLPLARLRARGELVEVRAADLRFTNDEAAAYLRAQMGFALGGAEVDTLEARTEGWIAALQLAAISMRGRDDVASFIAQFAGDDRYVVDYLADEVLERQPEAIRAFLLRTSVLGRLTGGLCDAVTGEPGGTAMLEALERANLFLVPLDDRRRWYRYHHLFADLLRARLLDLHAAEVPELHRRASAWWEEHREPEEAIWHALAAGDVERAADLIEPETRRLLQGRQEATLRRWLDALPDAVFDARPVLADAHAGTLLISGRSGDVDRRLAQAERWLELAATGDRGLAALGADGMVVTDLESLRRLPGAVALHRAGLAWMLGDLPGAIANARAAQAAAVGMDVEAGGAAGMLGLAHWTAGDLASAHTAWSEAVAALESAGHLADVLGCSIALGDIEVTQGRLGDARRTFERGLARSAVDGRPAVRGTADMHVGLAALSLERNDPDGARRHLEAASALGEAMGLPQHPYRWRVARAALLRAQGDPDAALALLDEAKRVYDGDFFPEVHPVASARARLWAATGRHAEALAWARERGLTTADEPAYLREDEHITLARALLAAATVDGSRAGALELARFLDRLLAAAEAGGRGRSVIEVLALRALACRVAGDRDGAAAALDRALALAAPEGFVRLFLDEGPAITDLLAAAARRNPASYAGRLLTAAQERPAAPEPGAPAARAMRQPLVEPLSERELEVLRLLASDLDGPAIASELIVSLNTMRTHTKNIFAKLGVNSRREAVSRATELGLLARTR
jgi:LuxR family maltose regulon positive regulatory protein